MFETTKLGGDKQPKWSSTNNRNIQYGHWLKDVEGKFWPETHGFQIQLGSKPPKPMGTLEFNQPICLRCVDYEGVNFDDLSSVSFLQNAINCAGMVVNAHFQTNPNIKLMLKYIFNIQCNHMCIYIHIYIYTLIVDGDIPMFHQAWWLTSPFWAEP